MLLKSLSNKSINGTIGVTGEDSVMIKSLSVNSMTTIVGYSNFSFLLFIC